MKGMNDKEAAICADKFYKDAHKVFGDDDDMDKKKKESMKSTDAEATEVVEATEETTEVAEVTEEAPVVEEKKEEEAPAVEETPAEQVSEEKISSEEVEAIVEQAKLVCFSDHMDILDLFVGKPNSHDDFEAFLN
jgi:hypothetical protein